MRAGQGDIALWPRGLESLGRISMMRTVSNRRGTQSRGRAIVSAPR
jgi:hypothetical protein